MIFLKSATAAALVAVAAFSIGLTDAHAGKKNKHMGGGNNHGKFQKHHKHHKHYNKFKFVKKQDCGHWMYKYKKTGKKVFLSRYYACIN